VAWLSEAKARAAAISAQAWILVEGFPRKRLADALPVKKFRQQPILRAPLKKTLRAMRSV
jgi:hypothetical protein